MKIQNQQNLLIWATTRKRKKQQIHLKCTLQNYQNLHKLNIPIEKIAKAVELNEEEVKAFLNEKKQEFFAIAKDIHNQCTRKNIKIIDVGADILVAGTAIINSKDYAETIKKR